jgi:hypothetical protein
MIRIVESVGGVGVDHERDRADAMPDGRDGLDVPSGFDLDFDALVAGGDLDAHAFDQLLE